MMVWDGVPADQVEDGTVGLQIGTVGDQIGVVGVEKDSPAEKSGMLKGQVILSIDGRSTKGMPLHNAAQALRGRPGTMVVLRVKTSLLPWGKKIPLVRATRMPIPSDEPVDGLIVRRVPLKEIGEKACPAQWQGCSLVLAEETCHYVCKAK
jgi:predicted metalloprotease with PDZ domain